MYRVEFHARERCSVGFCAPQESLGVQLPIPAADVELDEGSKAEEAVDEVLEHALVILGF